MPGSLAEELKESIQATIEYACGYKTSTERLYEQEIESDSPLSRIEKITRFFTRDDDLYEILETFKEADKTKDKSKYENLLNSLKSTTEPTEIVNTIRDACNDLYSDESPVDIRDQAKYLKELRRLTDYFVRQHNIDVDFNKETYKVLSEKKEKKHEKLYRQTYAYLLAEKDFYTEENKAHNIRNNELANVFRFILNNQNVSNELKNKIQKYFSEKISSLANENDPFAYKKISEAAISELIGLFSNETEREDILTAYDKQQLKIVLLSNHNLSEIIKIKETLQKFAEKHKLKINYAGLSALIRSKRIQNGEYSNLYKRAISTMDFVFNHPILATITGFIHKQRNNIDAELYDLTKMFCLLGYDKKISEILADFKKNANETDNTKQFRNLQSLVDKFSELINLESANPDVNQTIVKLLKKHLGKFAERHGFDKKLFNLETLSDSDNLDEKVIEEINKKTKDFRNRKFAYIENAVNEVTEHKRKIRFRKKILNHFSRIVSLIVGVAEGVVAAVLLGKAKIAQIIATGVGGTLVNYALFRNSSQKALKSIFITGLFRTHKKNQMSGRIKKGLLRFAVTFSACGGAAYGFLSYYAAHLGVPIIFKDILSTIAKLFAKYKFIALAVAGASVPHVVAAAVIVTFAILTGIGMATVFYVNTVAFAKEKLHLRVAHYFKKNFYDVWKKSENSQKRTAGQIAKAIWSCFVHGLCTIVATGIWIIATTAALPFFGLKALKVFVETLKCGQKLGTAFAKIDLGFGGPCVSLFYGIGIFEISAKFANFFVKLPEVIFDALSAIAKNPKGVADEIKKFFKEKSSNLVQKTTVFVNNAIRSFLLLCLGPNAFGIADGPANNSSSHTWVGKIFHGLHLGYKVIKGMIFTSAFVASCGPNAGAAINLTQTEPSAKLPEKNENAKEEIKEESKTTEWKNSVKGKAVLEARAKFFSTQNENKEQKVENQANPGSEAKNDAPQQQSTAPLCSL